ncbi:MAG: DUF2079 domain-containing protein [Chloroflexi bacterium]|nr:MAG: DUF2079 domain-containing protein [Chloroflexota bacterium]
MSVDALQIGGAQRTKSAAEAWWVFPAVPLLAAAVAFAWTLHGDLQRLYGMTSEAWDLAYDQQVIWNISQGQGFYSSFARANFLGIHLEPIFVVLAAVEKLWPSPTVLLIFSSAGLAATAPAAYLFFRAILPAERVESPWLAVALSAPIPFWAALQEAARDFFHPENMALSFALLAAWAGIRGRRVAMWSFCVLDLSCKEDQVYTVAMIAILMSAYGAPAVKKHWRFVLYLAVAWLLIGTGIVQQHFRNAGYSDFIYYLWLLGLDPANPVSPLAIAEQLVRPQALSMLAAIIASMFALPLLAPRWLLLAIPPYLANVLSAHNPQNDLHLHYVLLLLFPLMVAGGLGGRRLLQLRSIKPAVALAAMLPALILGLGMGRFPPALLSHQNLYSRPNSVSQLATATSMIPRDAPVNADAGLAAWLANRHTINDFPDKLDASCYVVIDLDLYVGRTTNRIKRQQAADALATSGRRVLYDDGRFQVWSPAGD